MRIGIALTDPGRSIASPSETYARRRAIWTPAFRHLRRRNGRPLGGRAAGPLDGRESPKLREAQRSASGSKGHGDSRRVFR